MLACEPKGSILIGLILSQGMCLGCQPGPRLGEWEEQLIIYVSHIDVSLPVFLFSPLSKDKLTK